jgi:ATP/maltotriose-dependent transcriptional regulator MalT
MLDRQPDDVQQLLLRTCLLDRVNGELADLLSGCPGSERILLELEDANAFVVALDPERRWFRSHHLLGDFLRLELRRTRPEEVPALHRRAAGWFAQHGQVAEAIRHTQAAGDWSEAARLLADHLFSLTLDGQAQTIQALLRAFPPGAAADHPELALVRAEGQRWLQRAAQALQTDTGPGIRQLLHLATGMLHAGRSRHPEALEVNAGEIRNARAVICLAEGSPAAALDALAEVLDGTAPVIGDVTVVEAQLLAALAHRALGDQRAANQAAERALALAEPDRLVLPFAMTGAGELLEALPRHETAHAALLTDILDLVHGASRPAKDPSSSPQTEALSPSELRVLRYLPTNLSRPEIASELSVSVNTVNTHVRNIYAKLQARDRSSAVQRARELRLLSDGRTR